ncbi:uncharacterized protein [Apostichopus japonicus]|uniref:uncharacterized protein n=1 Tax=Stichopus japonicus TaxID=307972 RepID=UPI003AB66EDC
MERDTFMLKVSPKEVRPSRRGMLSATSSLYDPLGFVAPFILTAKFLIQDLCSKGLRWDEIVGPEEQRQWNEWLAELPSLESVEVERCFKHTISGDVKHGLHIFCDASERGYAAVAYLRTEHLNGQIECSFVMGKARLCPLKRVTISRLELMSAVFDGGTRTSCY